LKLEKSDNIGFPDVILEIARRRGQADARMLLAVAARKLPNLKQVWN
jgi:hypothetical protein